MIEDAGQLLVMMRRAIPTGVEMAVPPPVLGELAGRLVAYEEDAWLRAEYLALPKFVNPMGSVQGGIVAAAVDGTYGMLSFLAKQAPYVTVTLDMQYVRPLRGDGGVYTVEVRLKAQTRRMLFMEGEARNGEGKIIATSTTTMLLWEQRKQDVV